MRVTIPYQDKNNIIVNAESTIILAAIKKQKGKLANISATIMETNKLHALQEEIEHVTSIAQWLDVMVDEYNANLSAFEASMFRDDLEPPKIEKR